MRNVEMYTPCSVEDEEPHSRAQRRGEEPVLEAREMRVEPGAWGSHPLSAEVEKEVRHASIPE